MQVPYIRITKEGLDLIKHFEGLRFKAYKPQGEKATKCLTIGYGHYGASEGDVITEVEAHTICGCRCFYALCLFRQKCTARIEGS